MQKFITCSMIVKKKINLMLLFLSSIFLLSIYYFHFYIGTNYESNFMEIFFTQTVNFLDFSFIQQAPVKVFSPIFVFKDFAQGK